MGAGGDHNVLSKGKLKFLMINAKRKDKSYFIALY